MSHEMPGAGSPQESVESQEQITRIVLTKDPQIVEELRAKLEEYDSRLGSTEVRYKIRILTRLLEDEYVNIEQIRSECIEDYEKRYREDYLQNAALVIHHYNEHGIAPRHEPIVINPFKLNADEDIRARLRAKLSDYESRLDPHAAPEDQNMDAAFKVFVLSELLGTGEIDPDALRQRAQREYGDRYSDDFFTNALAVIAQYNKNETEQLQNGGGF